MQLRIGIYGEHAEDFPEGERMLLKFYRSAGISAQILRFSSVQRLAAYCRGLIGKGEVFFPLLVRREYLPQLLPLVKSLNDEDEIDHSKSHGVTLEILLSDFPYPPDFCQVNREDFLPPASLRFPVKGGLQEFIPEQILYIETNGRCSRVHTEKGKAEILLSMKAVRKKLNGNTLFACPHISFLVNLAWVNRIEGYEVILKNEEKIPLSQKRSARFRALFHQYLSSLSKNL